MDTLYFVYVVISRAIACNEAHLLFGVLKYRFCLLLHNTYDDYNSTTFGFMHIRIGNLERCIWKKTTFCVEDGYF